MASAEGAEKREKLIFASIVTPNKSSETNALLLGESIRSFAGSLSKAIVLLFRPGHGDQLSAAVEDRLNALDFSVIPFEIDPEALRFPLSGHVHAAALAESIAHDRADLLAWLDVNTVVVQEPRDFLLQDDVSLGYRPVHHTLVGSRYDEPIDAFWSLIYRYCCVPESRVFPMMTHVDGTMIRPYFNAGLLVVRPEKRLLRAWRDAFFRVYREPPFQELYRRDERYRVFVHQAVLSGVILSTLATDEIQELPPRYNYPLHLYEEDVTGHPPTSLEELVTFRHEGFYKDPAWRKKMPADEPLKRWIEAQLNLL